MRICILLLCLISVTAQSQIKLDPDTGLIQAPGFIYVKAHCTVCHSAKLVTQNRMSRSGWLKTVRWMQKSQGLWPLGEHEDIVLNYLATNYPPSKGTRRANLPPHLLPDKAN